ncbi:hypothetical protein TSAR_005103 [Trichomalopsis sarcophagae]|uniref:DUF4780 domain-containing protein n=1 Tax=Trichomalopsis sarcophagae TaxID=543379 RepID=A0A232FLP6_9HYME|nr:hypothetical protein TSAR_005103 [Trichomalopsis sarcophagae]
MGSIIVEVSNTFLRDWLEEITSWLRPWEGAKLLMVGINKLRKPRRGLSAEPTEPQASGPVGQ